MVFLVIFVYLGFGLWCVLQCIDFSRRHRVASSFSMDRVGEGFLSLMDGNPLLILLVLPFSIVLWPLLCLLDLSEVPKKQREKLLLLKAERQERAEVRSLRHAVRGHEERLNRLIGQSGETVGVLSPMGQVRIKGKNWDANSVEGYLAPGRAVIVVGRQGKTLEVSETSEGIQNAETQS